MYRNIRIFNVILCSIAILFSQANTFVFTEEEVINLRDKIMQLENSDSTNTLIIKNLEDQMQLYINQTSIDSTIIENYKEQLRLKDDMIKEIKPKWYDNKYLWYSMGVASMIVPIWAVGQIK